MTAGVSIAVVSTRELSSGFAALRSTAPFWSLRYHEEKREARATDPKARAIIDRVDALPKETFARLHGAVRSLRPGSEIERHGDGGPMTVEGGDAGR